MSLNGSKSFIMNGMVINMDDARLKTLKQIEEFLKGTEELFRVSREERYPLVQRTLTRFGYDKLVRKERGVILRYLEAMTGLFRQQMPRLVQKLQKTGAVRLGYQTPRRGFQRVFGPSDVALLAEMDERHGPLPAPVTKKLMERGLRIYGEERSTKNGWICSYSPVR